MRVKMLVQTVDSNLGHLAKGQVIEVDPAVGHMWAARRIAEPVPRDAEPAPRPTMISRADAAPLMPLPLPPNSAEFEAAVAGAARRLAEHQETNTNRPPDEGVVEPQTFAEAVAGAQKAPADEKPPEARSRRARR